MKLEQQHLLVFSIAFRIAEFNVIVTRSMLCFTHIMLVLAFAFSLSAEIERNLISQRAKEAMARMKSEGLPVRRP